MLCSLILAVPAVLCLHVCLFSAAFILRSCSPVSQVVAYALPGFNLSHVSHLHLCCAAAVQQAGVDPLLVQEVFMGNVMSAGLGQVRHLSCKHCAVVFLHQSTAAAISLQGTHGRCMTHLYLA